MKRIILLAAIAIAAVVSFTSCGASRRTGCPMSAGIIH